MFLQMEIAQHLRFHSSILSLKLGNKETLLEHDYPARANQLFKISH